MEFIHKPVLLRECLEGLNIRPEGTYLDGTLGRAGHSREIARRLTTGRLICIDRDAAALDAAETRLADCLEQVTLIHGNFGDLGQLLDSRGISGLDGMLFDLGVSSPQLDDPERGFSYMQDAPLDMRMDRSEPLTADTVVNQWSQEELKRILWQYGEERYAPQIAAAIVRRRAERPITTTFELVDVIKSAMPGQALREKQHPAQGLERLAVSPPGAAGAAVYALACVASGIHGVPPFNLLYRSAGGTQGSVSGSGLQNCAG